MKFLTKKEYTRFKDYEKLASDFRCADPQEFRRLVLKMKSDKEAASPKEKNATSTLTNSLAQYLTKSSLVRLFLDSHPEYEYRFSQLNVDTALRIAIDIESKENCEYHNGDISKDFKFCPMCGIRIKTK